MNAENWIKELLQDMEKYHTLLETNDKRVHEQFAMLITAMTTQNIMNSKLNNFDINNQKGIKSFIKSSMKRQMKLMGYHKGLLSFLNTNLYFYVFQLYEEFYENYLEQFNVDKDIPTIDVQDTILQLAAYYINEQYKTYKIADICSFLKAEDTNILKNAVETILK